MKYNTTYTPKLNLKETLIEVNKIRRKVISFYEKRFNLIEVVAPLHDLESSEKIIDMNSETRHISFDFGGEYRVGKFYLSHTNWIHELINKTKLGPSEGYWTNSSYLWRDISETASVSAEKEEITIQIVLDKKADMKHEIEKEIFILYDEILNIQRDITKTQKRMSKDIKIFTSQELANLMPDLKPMEREEKIIQDMHSFILKNPGKKLLSGLRHAYIPPTLYDLNNYFKLFIKDKVNSLPAKIASVSQIITGNELGDQLKVYKEARFLEYDFYNKIILNKKNIIEIKINIPKLAMVILDKGHIGEVQPGATSNEVNSIKEKYKVEIL